MAYTQIIYISRSTFAPSTTTNGIEPNVARILAKSRVNNRKNGLVGVLYFGDGCFFQCLEGEESAVDKLYQTLLQDDRHTDIKLLSKKSVEELSFSEWSMKYVPLEDQMNRLLVSNGYKSFNPYQFSTHMIEKILELLFASNDYIFSPKAIPTTEAEVHHVEIEKVKRLAQLALTISIIALGLGLANIVKAV
jgi:hypothetical protein